MRYVYKLSRHLMPSDLSDLYLAPSDSAEDTYNWEPVHMTHGGSEHRAYNANTEYEVQYNYHYVTILWRRPLDHYREYQHTISATK